MPMTVVVEFIGLLILLVTFYILSQSYMKPMIDAVAVQSILLAFLLGVIGTQKHFTEMILIALLTFFVRGIIIPVILKWDIRKDPVWTHREVETAIPSLVLAGVIVAIAGYAIYRIVFHPIFKVRSDIPIVLLLLSFLIMIGRKNAMSQLIGYLSEENALLYASAIMNLPIILEAGVFLDLVGVVLVSIILAAEKEYGYLELEELVG
jgi:hydrogenase-4 component E